MASPIIWLELCIVIRYARGRQPLAGVPLVAREWIFYGTPKDLTRTEIYFISVRGELTSSNCLRCTKSAVLKLVKHAIQKTISMSAMPVVALPATLTTGSL